MVVKEKIIVPNSYKDKVKELVGKYGWSVGKPSKVGFMAIVIVCSFEKEFKDMKDYNEHSAEMDNQFVSDLVSVGFSKDFVEQNKKVIVPNESTNVSYKEHMTWREWHEQKHKK